MANEKREGKRRAAGAKSPSGQNPAGGFPQPTTARLLQLPPGEQSAGTLWTVGFSPGSPQLLDTPFAREFSSGPVYFL